MYPITIPMHVEPQVRLHSLTPHPSGERGGEIVLHSASGMTEVRSRYRLLRKAGLSAALSRMVVLGLTRSALMGGGTYEGNETTFTATTTMSWESR